jgi:putative nucleotidyltransferase with HDIG domain
LTLFIGLAALAELFSVQLFASSRSYVSVSSIIAMATILVFGPWAGALTHMVSGVMTAVTGTWHELPKEERASWLRRSAFNAGMLVTAATLAGWVYVLAGGTPGEVFQVSTILPLVGAATADTVANVAILIGVLVLQTRRHPLEIWKRDFQWASPIAILGGIVGGGALALAYEMFNVVGVAVFFLPVLTTGYAFRLYVDNMKGYVDRLEEVNLTLEESNLELLETLGAVIDAYDVYTYGHSTQVAVYAGAIAEKMNLSPKEQAVVVRAALVHDIGKVGIVDSITAKTGRLTDEEYNVMRRHPAIGAQIVGQMKGLQELTPLVRHHHERWDGGGYPDGLEGAEIPLGARILALADTLDAMFSDRPYRSTRSFREVVEEIVRSSGEQYDPDVVAAFLVLAKEKGRDFFANSAASVDRAVQVARVASTDDGGVRYFLKKSMLADLTSRSAECDVIRR